MLKSTSYILFSVSLCFCATLNNFPVWASYENILETVDKDFESSADKFTVVTRPMNRAYVRSLKDSDTVDTTVLYTISTPGIDIGVHHWIKDRTHALALAISAGDEVRVKKYLSVVKDPTDSSLLVGGAGQNYTMVHQAADPIHPIFIHPQFMDQAIGKTRLRIIDHVAEAGFDFNYCNEGCYDPPFYTPRMHDDFRARLLLHGADPTIVGDGREPLNLEEKLFYYANLAYTQIQNEKLTNIHPVACVQKQQEEVKRQSEKN